MWGVKMTEAKLGDRALFPHLRPHAFLAHAAVSPLSEPVVAAMMQATMDFARDGVAAVRPWVAQRDRLRAKLATFIGASEDEVGLVSTTSHGVLTVAHGVDWEPGDRILLLRGEFPTNITPWQQAAKAYGCEIVWLDVRELMREHDPELLALRDMLAGGVRLLAVSAVQFQTGWRMPLERIGQLCAEHDTLFFVDAIQAVGGVPFDVKALGVDYAACGSHKWLLGPEAAGFVYISQERMERFQPRLSSWLSHEDALSFLFEPDQLRYDRPMRKRADVVEKSASNTIGYAGVEASLDVLMGLGTRAIHEHVTHYLDALEARLDDALGWQSVRSQHAEHRSNILSYVIPGGIEPKALGDLLTQRGLGISTPDGMLRFAPHWPNHTDEHELVVRHVVEAARELS